VPVGMEGDGVTVKDFPYVEVLKTGKKKVKGLCKMLMDLWNDFYVHSVVNLMLI